MRLIDADKLEIRKLAEFNDEYGDAVPVYGVTAEDIDNAPTVDAGVKCGEWIKKPYFYGNTYQCSNCGSTDYKDYLGTLFKFCPGCGYMKINGGTKCEND